MPNQQEQKNRESGELLFKIIVCLFVVCMTLLGILSGLGIYNEIRPDTTYDFHDNQLDFELSEDYSVGSCVSKSMKASVGVYVVDKLPNDYVGRYYADRQVIVLVDTDIETVAHEVSHFVDDVMRTKQIEDGETRAYLQGYFTDCVENLTWGLNRTTTKII